jgi:hypothetical protein
MAERKNPNADTAQPKESTTIRIPPKTENKEVSFKDALK